MAVFPSGIKVFTSKTDLVDTVLADHVNVIQEEVHAVEAALGTGMLSSSWSGTFSAATSHTSLASRLANIEAGISGLATSKQDASSAVTTSGAQTLTDKTLTAPVIATIYNGGVLTLPSGTRTMVARDTTDTLSNKTLSAPVVTGGATFNGSTSGSIVLAAPATAGNNALTLPAVTDTLATLTSAETFTNKTLSGDDNTFSDIPQSAVTDLTDDLALLAPLSATIATKSANYTLALADAGQVVEASAAAVITVPTNSSVAFPIGTSILIVRTGTGAVSIAASSGVTIRYQYGLTLMAQYAAALIYKRGTDEWVAVGALVA